MNKQYFVLFTVSKVDNRAIETDPIMGLIQAKSEFHAMTLVRIDLASSGIDNKYVVTFHECREVPTDD